MVAYSYFVNESGLIGQIINGLIGIAGSTFLALLLILMIFIIIGLALSIPTEIIAILYLPLLMTMAAYTGDFVGVTGCFLILLGFFLADKLLR